MRKVVIVLTAVAIGTATLVPAADAAPSRWRRTLPVLTPAAPDALTDALEDGDLTDAEYALNRAKALSHLRAVRADFGEVVPSDPDLATMVLRDLALRVGDLEGEERSEAEAILARPNQGGPNDGTLEYDRPEQQPVETAHFMIHYVGGGQHEASPSYAAEVGAIMEEVWTREVTQMGWRPPLSDQDATPNGGNEKYDIYLGNIGADGIYGYCPIDGPKNALQQYSYCVLDNDFSPGQFEGPVSGLNAARVTAAHEFNHAIQFSYDVTDDMWMLEATATWMEDQVYDDLPDATYNDSYQYLKASSLAKPNTSADTFDFFTGFHYGQFIWMRYLSERFGNNDIVRQIFEKTAEPGYYSLKSIEAVLASQSPSVDFASSFTEFAAWNATPRTFYEEGANYETEVTPVRTAKYTLAGTTPAAGTFSNVDHLTSRYVGFKPGATVAAGDQITLSVDLGTGVGNSMNRAKVVLINGAAKDVRDIPLSSGAGHITVPFAGQTEVVLVMSNASNRMNNCDPNGAPFGGPTCGGSPADENKTFKYAGVIGTTPATPGGPSAPRPVVTDFRAAPNPFTPNGDGRKDTTKISWHLNVPATVTIDVFKGTRYIGSFPDRNKGAGKDSIRWDGGVPGGKVGKAGIYTFKLTAQNDGGTSKKKTQVTLRR